MSYTSFHLVLQLPREPVRTVFKLQVQELGLGGLAARTRILGREQDRSTITPEPASSLWFDITPHRWRGFDLGYSKERGHTS